MSAVLYIWPSVVALNASPDTLRVFVLGIVLAFSYTANPVGLKYKVSSMSCHVHPPLCPANHFSQREVTPPRPWGTSPSSFASGPCSCRYGLPNMDPVPIPILPHHPHPHPLPAPLAADLYARFKDDTLSMLELPEATAHTHLPFGLCLFEGIRFTEGGFLSVL